MHLDELKRVLHEGFLIMTRSNQDKKWQYNIIHSIYSDTIAINFDSDKEKVGQVIFFKISVPEAEYLAKGTVLDISDYKPLVAKVKLIECDKYINMRRFERYPSNAGCNIKLSGEDIGAFTMITNICVTGAYIETTLDIKKDTKIRMDVIIGNNRILTLNGQMLRKENIENITFGYGAVFRDNSNQSIESLTEFLNTLEVFQQSTLKEWEKGKFLVNQKDTPNTKVLIVDDIKFTRAYLRNIVQSLGINNIQEAANGTEAVQKSVVFRPDIITLDISMPGINGIEALRYIRGSNLKSKVIVISAFIDQESKKLLSELGVDSLIAKPFDQSQIINAITHLSKEVSLC